MQVDNSGTGNGEVIDNNMDFQVLLQVKEKECEKLEDKYKKLKHEKKSLNDQKMALEETIKNWEGKFAGMCGQKKALEEEIQH